MKVLFYAYSFPPANLPSTPRTWNMARSLADSGYTLDVVTMQSNAWRNTNGQARAHPGIRRIEVPARFAWMLPWELRTPQKGAAAVLGGIARRMARASRIDPYAGWTLRAADVTADLSSGDVDVVLATGSPFSSFELARRTAKRLGKPYVIDYRDLWTLNPHTPNGTAAGEREIVRDAAAIMTVSPSMLRVIDREYGVGARGYVLPNAFDEVEMAAVRPVRLDHFSVVYTGQFYPPKRTVEPLLTALRGLTLPDWKLHYAGAQTDYVMRAATAAGVADRVICHGELCRRDSLALTAAADVAVVITSVDAACDDSDLGIVTSKVFDILGLRRPLLVIAPEGSDIEAMLGERVSTACFAAIRTAAISRWIEGLAESSIQPEPAVAHDWHRRGETLRCILEKVVAS